MAADWARSAVKFAGWMRIISLAAYEEVRCELQGARVDADARPAGYQRTTELARCCVMSVGALYPSKPPIGCWGGLSVRGW